MREKIAVLLDKEDETACFNVGGEIRVYLKEENEWKVLEAYPFEPVTQGGLSGIRKQIRTLLESLGDCKILVAEKITGIPYTILDASGVNLWEIKGKPEQFLDEVLKSELVTIKVANSETPYQPKETHRQGAYYFNMKKAMEESEGMISTKQMLIPFFQSVPFYELKLVCDHIPPWFDKEFEKHRLTYEIIARKNKEEEVIIRRAVCKAD